MAQDFASRQRNQTTPPVRPRGAVPKPEPKKPAPKPDLWGRLPGWSWLLVGLVLGGGLTQSLHLVLQAEKTPQGQAVAVIEATAEPVNETLAEPAPPTHQPRFDFYTLLPESEVIAPKVEAYQSTPRDAENLPRFMLQVASFRLLSDAQRLERRLLEMGFENIRMNEVESTNGDTWFRVQVGPYQDRRVLARAQDDLARAGFDFLLLRLRDEPEPQPQPDHEATRQEDFR